KRLTGRRDEPERRACAADTAALDDSPDERAVGGLPNFVHTVVAAGDEQLAVGREDGVTQIARVLSLPHNVGAALRARRDDADERQQEDGDCTCRESRARVESLRSYRVAQTARDRSRARESAHSYIVLHGRPLKFSTSDMIKGGVDAAPA